MKRHTKGAAAALAVLAIAGVAAVASAHGGPALSDAGPANTKTAGITLPDKLSPQWREITVAQGSNALENPSATSGYYGYYNDGPMLPAPGDVQAPGTTSRRRRASPTRTPTSSSRASTAPTRSTTTARTSSTRATSSTRPSGELHHAHQPRRRRGPPGDEARRDRGRRQTPMPEIDGSTWDPFAQRLLFTTEGGAERRRRRGDARLPVQGHDALGRARPGRLRGHPERQYGNVYIVEDVGGAGRQGQHARQAAEQLPLPLPAVRPDQPRQGRQAAGAAGRVARASGPDRLPRRPGRRRHPLARHRKDLHTYGHDFKTTWVTIHDTPEDGTARRSTPTRRPRRPAARRSSGPENGQFKPGIEFNKFFFAETGDTTLTTEAGTQYGGFGAIQELHAEPEERQGHAAALLPVGQDALELRQRHVLRQDARDLRPGHGRRPAQLAQRARLGLPVRRQRRLLAGGAQPVRVIAEGRDPSATIDSAIGAHLGQRLQQRGRQRDHRHPRVQRRPDGRRPARRRDPEGPLARLAALLHPPARRQRDLGGHPRRVAAHRTFAHRVTPRPGHLPGRIRSRSGSLLSRTRAAATSRFPGPRGVRSSMAHSGHMKSTCRGCWPSSVGALSSSLLQK